MKQSPLKRNSVLKRGGMLRRRKRKTIDSFGEIWREGLGGCVVCPAEGRACSGPVQAHHIIARQTLRRRGLLFETLDTRNRLGVCEFRHEQHTTGFKAIPRDVLPSSVFDFAAELGLEWYIEKHYAVATEAAA